MRNYRYAIVPYDPVDEFKLREHVRDVVGTLTASGWVVLTISLHKLLLQRVRAHGENVVHRMIETERSSAKHGPERGINYLRTKLGRELDGVDGIAADVSREILAFTDAHPDQAERTVVFVGRAGALYPFFRVSALLKHLDGKTRNTPVVLLYPGECRGDAGLAFMGELEPDRDYRPRIYP
ncbi:MAG: DUF1788 domain-containing protein [Deltaproteobacteria bacterium]|nr:DUF1788 domain-containing protein [Deltaproteobacteria bacterium]